MRKTLRCAVAGAGRIAWGFHLPQICMREGFELAAVADPDRQRLEEVKHAFHPAAVFTDLETMLREVHPDLTVIASPTIFHKEQALLAFRYVSASPHQQRGTYGARDPAIGQTRQTLSDRAAHQQLCKAKRLAGILRQWRRNAPELRFALY